MFSALTFYLCSSSYNARFWLVFSTHISDSSMFTHFNIAYCSVVQVSYILYFFTFCLTYMYIVFRFYFAFSLEK